MLRIYASPQGGTYQYEEGEQPEGYVLAEIQSKETAIPTKERKTSNKARRTATKKD